MNVIIEKKGKCKRKQEKTVNCEKTREKEKKPHKYHRVEI